MSDKDRLADLHPDTLLVHGGTLRSSFGETPEALFMTSAMFTITPPTLKPFKDNDGLHLQPVRDPTNTMFETRMALLEGAEAARSTATAMTAVSSALLGYLKAGDHVVAAKALFGACRLVIEDMLPRFGISSTLIDGRDLSAWRGIRGNIRVLFCETPANPTLELVDLAGVAAIAKTRPSSWSTMCSQPRCFKSRSSSAQTL